MSARVTWTGLDELRAALRSLPSDLAGEAEHIVEGAANGAAVEARAGYASHIRSGNLIAHVDVSKQAAGRYGVGFLVINRAKHAWLFENGSQARHTAIGANRGSMPATPTFVPAMIRARRRMYDQLRGVLERAGLIVSGDAS